MEVLQENLEIKMSEIILHLADDLLKNTKTKKECLQFIGMVCFAWNLSVLFNPKQQKLELEQVLQDFDDPEEKQEVKSIIHSIITKNSFIILISTALFFSMTSKVTGKI
jgi:hypothetical protein